MLFDERAMIRHLVPAARTRFSYFRSRCYAEGLSKALVTASVGTADGLSAERRYTTRTLPSGVARGLADAARGDLSGLGRAGAIVAGLGATAAGYASGRGRAGHGGRCGAARRRSGGAEAAVTLALCPAGADPDVPRDRPALGDRQPPRRLPRTPSPPARLPARRGLPDGDRGRALGDLAGGPAELPDRPVVLTFDDGYADFHTGPCRCWTGMASRPRCSSPPAGSKTPDHSRRGRRPGRMLSWSQIDGGGPCWHRDRRAQPPASPAGSAADAPCSATTAASKAQLEDKLGSPVAGLAYPFGYSNARVRQAARDLGYDYACAVGNAMIDRTIGSLALPRLTVRRSTGMPEFRQIVQGATSAGSSSRTGP